jgi:hypothetical protein
VVLLVLFGILSAAFAMIFRSILVSFAVLAGSVVLSYFTSQERDIGGNLPGGWIASFMNFQDGMYRGILDYMWAPATPGHSSGLAFGKLVLLALIAAAVVVYIVPRRKPVA